MQNTISLTAVPRTITGKAVATLRRAGKIPGILYGSGTNRMIEVDRRAFSKVYAAAGESTLVDVIIGETPAKTLIQDVQFDAVTGKPIHVDFHEISMTELLTAAVPLIAAGESLAVKGLGGILVKNLGAINVQCLPSDLVHELPVSIQPLKNFGDMIRVRDLVAPPGITFLSDPDTVVFTVSEPRSEEELKKLEEKVETDVSKVEVAKKEKKTEEGEEAAVPEKEGNKGKAPKSKE